MGTVRAETIGVKILVIGTSASLGEGLAPGQRFTDILAALLEEQFPDRLVAVHARGWGYLSQDRLETLANEIEERRPDYLLLEPSPLWVTFPMVEPAIRRRLPDRLKGPFDHWTHANHRFESRLLQGRLPWLFHVYRQPLYLTGKALFGAVPLYETQEALAFVDRLVVTAKRQESMSILMLAGTLPSMEEIVSHAAWPVVRRIIPPGSERSLQLLAAGLRDLSESHRIGFVDTWNVLCSVLVPSSFLADGLHIKSEATRLRATEVCNAIAEVETEYGRSPEEYAVTSNVSVMG